MVMGGKFFNVMDLMLRHMKLNVFAAALKTDECTYIAIANHPLICIKKPHWFVNPTPQRAFLLSFIFPWKQLST